MGRAIMEVRIVQLPDGGAPLQAATNNEWSPAKSLSQVTDELSVEPSRSLSSSSIGLDVAIERGLDALLTPKRAAGGILRASDTPGTGQSVRFGMRLYDDGDESKLSGCGESAVGIEDESSASLALPTLVGYSNIHDESFESTGGPLGSRSNGEIRPTHIDQQALDESFDESFLRAEVARAKRAMIEEGDRDEDPDADEGSDTSEFLTAASSRASAWGTPRSVLSSAVQSPALSGLPTALEMAHDGDARMAREMCTMKMDHSEAALNDGTPSRIKDAGGDSAIFQAIDSLDTAHTDRADMLLQQLNSVRARASELQRQTVRYEAEADRARQIAQREKDAHHEQVLEWKRLVETLKAQLACRNERISRVRPNLSTGERAAKDKSMQAEDEESSLSSNIDLAEALYDLERVKDTLEAKEFEWQEEKVSMKHAYQAEKEEIDGDLNGKKLELVTAHSTIASLTERLEDSRQMTARLTALEQELAVKDDILSAAHRTMDERARAHIDAMDQLRKERDAGGKALQDAQEELKVTRQDNAQLRVAMEQAEVATVNTHNALVDAQHSIARLSDRQDQEDATVTRAQTRVAVLENEMRDRGMTIVRLQKTLKRQEADLASYDIALASKQQEIKMLKRIYGHKSRRSSAATGATTMTEAMSTMTT